MDLSNLAEIIRRQRLLKGLTQEQLERKLKFPQKSLTRLENGQRLPTTFELTQLAEFFQIPIADLLENKIPEEDPLLILFRADPRLKKNAVVREEIDRHLTLCKEGIFLEKLLKKPAKQYIRFSSQEKPTNPIQAIKQGEQAAKEERKRLGLGNSPLQDLPELFSSQGIWCATAPFSQEISGLFVSHSSLGQVILANTTHAPTRQRFSYAHEYGHALFDADCSALVSNSENASTFIEKRANSFAAAFLMPEEGIAETLLSLNKGTPSRSFFSIFDAATEGVIEAEERETAKNQKLSPENVAFLARRFGVSYQAAAYRLHSLRYISNKELETLLEKENKGRDYLRLLDLEDPKESNSPQRELRAYLLSLTIDAYRQEKISRGRLIELSKLFNLRFQDLLNLIDSDGD